jgi:hypothetical protein
LYQVFTIEACAIESGAVAQFLHARLFGAVIAAEHPAALLQAVADIPTSTPSANPTTVLWSPSRARLIGRFHPGQNLTKGGAMFAAYAGNMR